MDAYTRIAELVNFLNRERKFDLVFVGKSIATTPLVKEIEKMHQELKIKRRSERSFLADKQIASKDNQLIVFFFDKDKHKIDINSLYRLEEICSKNPFVIFIESNLQTQRNLWNRIHFIKKKKIKYLNEYLRRVQLKGYIKPHKNITKRQLFIDGKLARFKKIKREIKILAIITVYNESDIIQQNIEYLVRQGIDVHIIDNWSSDGSYQKVRKLQRKHDGITVERFPKDKPAKYYEWKRILQRVEKIANDSKYDWILHYDSDEFREPPWRKASLYNGINFVDSCGYNAIDFTVLNYRYTKTPNSFSEKDNPLTYFRYCEFGKHPAHFVQVKAWKNFGQTVELWKSGGHDVSFYNISSFPLKFLINHYPLRSPKQAKKKLFKDRIPRFSPEEVKRGWHSHYNRYKHQKEIKFDPKYLIDSRSDTFFKDYIVELISGVGLEKKT